MEGCQMKTPKLIYIAGPPRNRNPLRIENNIKVSAWEAAAELVSYELVCYGFYPVHPYLKVKSYFLHAKHDEFWLIATRELMRRCDAVYFMPDWRLSKGARSEHDEAQWLGMKIFYSLDELKAETWED
jgi:hypothetical protein